MTAEEERAAIVAHIQNVGNAFASLGREREAFAMHMLSSAIEQGAHHFEPGGDRSRVVDSIVKTLQTVRPKVQA